MPCNKCRQLEPHEGDTWCLSCSAWEQLGVELAAQWNNPNLRATAGDLVISLTRNIRALRSYAGSLKSAGDRQASRTGAQASQAAPKRQSAPRELPRPPPVPPKEENQEESDSEEESEEEDEEEVPAGAAAKSDPARRPSEPPGPPPPRVEEARARERSRERSRRHHSSGHREHREHREHHSDRQHKTERGRRGGRKRTGLHRALTQPHLKLRRKPPANYWDGPDRRDREPLPRHR
eukprot:s1949_g5.t1